MKKLILIILAFVSINVKGQGAAFTTIRNVTDTIYSGDSLKVNFTYTVNGSSGQNVIQVMLINNAFGYSNDIINQYVNTIYTAQPRCYNDIDGTIYFKIKTTPAMGTGNVRIFANTNEKPTYIKPTVGIEEFYKNLEITSIKYFDIYGKEKAPHEGELLIKVSTFSNGYQKTEKVIIQP